MKSLYRCHSFPSETISHAIWLYHRLTLSFRDVEDLLAERGISEYSLEKTAAWRPMGDLRGTGPAATSSDLKCRPDEWRVAHGGILR